MLHIEKKDEPRVMRTKVAQIKSSPEWKRIEVGNSDALRGQFDLLPKAEVRQALLEEQHYLCAYCMKRIGNEELHTTIEHWSPLSKDKDNALSYHNFLAVCKGGADVSGNTKGRILCCDASKGDQEIRIDPVDQEMMSHIVYDKEGGIEFKPKAPSGRWMTDDIKRINADINDVLCLNGRPNKHGSRDDTSTGVVKGRKDAWESGQRILKRLLKKNPNNPEPIRKEIERLQMAVSREPFVGVTIFYLQRKCRQMEAQRGSR